MTEARTSALRTGQIASRSLSNDAYAWTGAYNVDRAYVTNGLNQYSSSGPVTLGYDARGNIATGGVQSWAYDNENRLVSASGFSDAVPGATLGYDPLGRLQAMGPTGAAADVQRRWLYDGDALVAEYDGNGTQVWRHVPGPGTDETILTYGGAGNADKRYLHADERGSIVSVTNGSAAVLATNSYDEYGIPGTGNAGRFQHTGQVWLAELGLYHYKARVYSPTLGRFLQTDPAGSQDDRNLYAYVGNDPVNRSDPSGLRAEAVGRAASSAWNSVSPILPHSGGLTGGLNGFAGTGVLGVAASASITGRFFRGADSNPIPTFSYGGALSLAGEGAGIPDQSNSHPSGFFGKIQDFREHYNWRTCWEQVRTIWPIC